MYEAIRRLPIHKDVVAFLLAVDDVVANLPRDRWYLRDQIRRAALSVLLNLREGASETLPREKARLYRLAKRSAAEAAAGLEIVAEFMPEYHPAILALDRTASRITTDLHRLSLLWLTRSRRAGEAGRQAGSGKPTRRPLRP